MSSPARLLPRAIRRSPRRGAGTADEPDVESHLARVAGPRFYADGGVDVAHVHHHARRTSSNAALVEVLAPKDGRSRNVIAGINGGYVGSPHAEVLRAWADGGRLGDGFFWTTDSALGADHPRLRNASGPVVVQTFQRGAGYRVQAAGEELFSRAFASVRR